MCIVLHYTSFVQSYKYCLINTVEGQGGKVREKVLEVKFAVVSISEGFDERETLSSSRRKLELILGKGLALAEAFMRNICYQRWDVHKHIIRQPSYIIDLISPFQNYAIIAKVILQSHQKRK